MFGRFARKLSRTKSDGVSFKEDVPSAETKSRAFSLTPSDEQIISSLTFSPETQIVERVPKKQSPSIATGSGWSERTVYNNTEKGFLSLPTEILVFLQSYLRVSSEVSLRQSCSRFFHLYTTPSFYLSGEDQFDFICMTERDQDPQQLSRLVCGRCRQLHPKHMFSSSEIVRAPLDRDCRQIWLCAHRFIGYAMTIKKIKAGAEGPFRAENIEPCSRCREYVRNRSVADRLEKGTSDIHLESPTNESMLISKIALLQAPSPAHNTRASANGMYTEIFLAKDVSAALQAIDFRICPHIKLGDPFVLSKFCRSCLNTQRLAPGVKGPPCIAEHKREFGDARRSGKCKGSCYVRSCRTQFMFQARESLSPDASGKRQVWLMIVSYRWLGALQTKAKDPAWLMHAVDAKERAEMRDRWDKRLKDNRNRQCMPNWEICLLHPEDSGLRTSATKAKRIEFSPDVEDE